MSFRRRRSSARSCNSPLWQADRTLRRFAPAEYIKKYLKGYYDMVIIDEIQDYKAEGTLAGQGHGRSFEQLRGLPSVSRAR